MRKKKKPRVAKAIVEPMIDSVDSGVLELKNSNKTYPHKK